MNVIWTPQLDEAATRWQALADRLGRDQFAPLAPELDRDLWSEGFSVHKGFDERTRKN